METCETTQQLLSIAERLRDKLSHRELEALKSAAHRVALDETLRQIEKKSRD